MNGGVTAWAGPGRWVGPWEMGSSWGVHGVLPFLDEQETVLGLSLPGRASSHHQRSALPPS